MPESTVLDPEVDHFGVIDLTLAADDVWSHGRADKKAFLNRVARTFRGQLRLVLDSRGCRAEREGLSRRGGVERAVMMLMLRAPEVGFAAMEAFCMVVRRYREYNVRLPAPFVGTTHIEEFSESRTPPGPTRARKRAWVEDIPKALARVGDDAYRVRSELRRMGHRLPQRTYFRKVFRQVVSLRDRIIEARTASSGRDFLAQLRLTRTKARAVTPADCKFATNLAGFVHMAKLRVSDAFVENAWQRDRIRWVQLPDNKPRDIEKAAVLAAAVALRRRL